jgi:hypothetical protein
MGFGGFEVDVVAGVCVKVVVVSGVVADVVAAEVVAEVCADEVVVVVAAWVVGEVGMGSGGSSTLSAS